MGARRGGRGRGRGQDARAAASAAAVADLWDWARSLVFAIEICLQCSNAPMIMNGPSTIELRGGVRRRIVGKGRIPSLPR